MLFHVRMDVNLPQTMPEAQSASLKKEEMVIAQALQACRKWRHLWRIAGQYANISVFDVDSIEELHTVLSTLPLFPFMKIEVMALCRHPSSIHGDDR
ncbi:muconolactone Delta-isomerase [Pseudoduganella sp. UC29_106]|uniref:muconolactone Delta-isomerase n=1 Tax=Pseudoduganella sp. UC29_106 TaxID=3374553 RepID=UPI003757BB9E